MKKLEKILERAIRRDCKRNNIPYKVNVKQIIQDEEQKELFRKDKTMETFFKNILSDAINDIKICGHTGFSEEHLKNVVEKLLEVVEEEREMSLSDKIFTIITENTIDPDIKTNKMVQDILSSITDTICKKGILPK